MMSMRWIAVALAVPLAVIDMARAEPGTAVLDGTARLVVKRCGTARGSFGGTLTVASDGTWSFASPDGTYGGTSMPVGRSGRKLRLALDDSATAAEIASAQEEISALCEVAVTVTEARLKTAILSLDRKRTTSKLAVKYLFKGTANGGHGTATWKLVGKGPWTPGP